MLEQDYYLEGYGQPGLTETVSEDYLRLVRCFWVFGTAAVIAAAVFVFTGNLALAGGICGFVGVVLSVFHIPFGLFILFSLLSIENAVQLHPYFTVSKAMGVVVLFSFLLHMFRAKLIFDRNLNLMGAFVLWGVCTSIWSKSPYWALLNCLSVALSIGLIVIMLNTVQDKKSLFLVLSGFAAGAFVASFMVVTGRVAERSFSSPDIERATLSEGANTLVLALALGLGFLVVFYMFFMPGKLKKIAAIGLLPLIFLAMVKTQSRMPTFAAISIPVFALILGSKSQYRFRYFCIAVILGLIAYVSIKLVIQSDLMTEAARKRLTEQGFGESGRLQFWKWGLEAFVYRPLHGYGFNNFHLIPNNVGQKAAHNTFIAVMVDTGLIGLSLAIAIVITLYKQVMRLSDVGLKWLGLAMLMYPMMTGITVTNYIKKDFWYALGIVVVVIHIGKLQEERAREQLEYPLYDTELFQKANG